MKKILLALLLLASPVHAADFADTDTAYMWDITLGTQYFPTWA